MSTRRMCPCSDQRSHSSRGLIISLLRRVKRANKTVGAHAVIATVSTSSTIPIDSFKLRFVGSVVIMLVTLHWCAARCVRSRAVAHTVRAGRSVLSAGIGMVLKQSSKEQVSSTKRLAVSTPRMQAPQELHQGQATTSVPKQQAWVSPGRKRWSSWRITHRNGTRKIIVMSDMAFLAIPAKRAHIEYSNTHRCDELRHNISRWSLSDPPQSAGLCFLVESVCLF